MSISQLASNTADHDLTSTATVLSTTPSATDRKEVQVVLVVGTGAKPLSGDGGDHELTIEVGGIAWQGGAVAVAFGEAGQVHLPSDKFVVESGETVVVKLKSPNAADTDVTVEARLNDVGAVEVSSFSGTAKTKIDNIPQKSGGTYRHRQVASDSGNKSADVVIEDAS